MYDVIKDLYADPKTRPYGETVLRYVEHHQVSLWSLRKRATEKHKQLATALAKSLYRDHGFDVLKVIPRILDMSQKEVSAIIAPPKPAPMKSSMERLW